jgi:adenylylsulfate kinase
MKESQKRSLVKAITYRILIIILDFVAVYLLTGKVAIAVSFMVISNLYTAVAYYIHERAWNKINWGRK